MNDDTITDQIDKQDKPDRADFEFERQITMKQSYLKGNSHLRMIPEVQRDNGAKLVAETSSLDDAPDSPPPSPKASEEASTAKLIQMLETSLTTMTQSDIDKVRLMVSHSANHFGENNTMRLVTLFIAGMIVGGLIVYCSAQQTCANESANADNGIHQTHPR